MRRQRNGGRVNDSCKRWRNGRGNVTVEELESSLNLVCNLLSKRMLPPVIGFRFTHHFFFSNAYAGYGIGCT